MRLFFLNYIPVFIIFIIPGLWSYKLSGLVDFLDEKSVIDIHEMLLSLSLLSLTIEERTGEKEKEKKAK